MQRLVLLLDIRQDSDGQQDRDSQEEETEGMASPQNGANKAQKPHAVCVPYPAQGHINPVLKLAKILHSRGFHITFVYTELNHGLC